VRHSALPPHKDNEGVYWLHPNIGVKTLLNSVGREPQSTLPQSDFQGLEIQLREGFPT
jgi:hypothetical protein